MLKIYSWIFFECNNSNNHVFHCYDKIPNKCNEMGKWFIFLHILRIQLWQSLSQQECDSGCHTEDSTKKQRAKHSDTQLLLVLVFSLAVRMCLLSSNLGETNLLCFPYTSLEIYPQSDLWSCEVDNQ